ncbi:MAG: branched-chain amino acid transporter AzlD [Clostridiales bacterium]|nr:branched-chain amino acid transporter AzlD [Clostridiales bacterium]
MTLSPIQILVIIAAVALGTMITRFLPFFLFPDNKKRPTFVIYLGKVLPYAVIGLLVVYCLREISFSSPAGWLPEGIAILCIAILHFWRENVLLSIGVGTAVYMLLVQYVF